MERGDLRSRSGTILVVATLVVAVARPAGAQSAEAEALFREGRQLIKRGQLAAGCDKLAASDQLETSVGTLLNLGDCRERLGKLATAWAAFRRAEALAGRIDKDDRRRLEAGRRAIRLEPRLPELVIEVTAPIEGLIVRRDGAALEAATWGTPLPIDPGSHVIVAEAPGRVDWRTSVWVVADRKQHRVVVPTLEPIASEPGASLAELANPPRDVPTYEASESSSRWTPLRKTGVVVAIAGVGAFATAGYFAVRSNDDEAEANRRCPDPMCSDVDAIELNESARTAAKRANVLTLAGAGAVGAAVALWFIGAPNRAPAITPVASPNQVGVAYIGGF